MVSIGMDIPLNLAKNVLEARRKRQLTQQGLADIAGIPRSTITHIESGQGNPSLQNLSRLANALQLSIEELLAVPRSATQLIAAADVPVQSRATGQVKVFKLLPERINGLEIDRFEMQPQASLRGTPHMQGSKEYLHCVSGTISVLLGGELLVLTKGDVLAFPGDLAHSYRNSGQAVNLAISIVVPLPRYHSAVFA